MFVKKYKCSLTPLNIREQIITTKTEIKILGITFTKNLLWNKHIQNRIDKLKRTNHLLKIICTKRKSPHIDTGIPICRALTEGIV